MSEVQQLKSYLVKLGFSVDSIELTKFKNALKSITKLSIDSTETIAKTFIGFQAGVTAGLFGVSAAVLATVEDVAKADQSFRLMGERMFIGTQNARSMQLSLNALGLTIEDITRDQEAYSRFEQLQTDQKLMATGLGGDFESNMKQIRNFTMEVSRFKLELEYFKYGVVNDLFKSFGGADKALASLQHLNNYIIFNLPTWSKEFSADLVPILKDTWEIFKRLTEIVGDLATDFANFIGVVSGDDSIKSTSFDFHKFAGAIEHVVHWMAILVEWMEKLERHQKLLTILGAGLGGAAIGSTVPVVGTVTGGLIGAGTASIYELISSFGQQDAKDGKDAKARKIDLSSLANAVSKVESGGRQYDSKGNIVTSSAGALGIMQLMPSTAKSLRVNPYDAADNMRGGMLLLQQLLQHYNGNLDYALAAYNSNPTYVDSTIKAGRQFAPDIQKYVQAVERTYMRDNSGATVNNVVNVGGVTVNGTNLTGEQIGKHVAAKIQQYNSNQTKRQLQELSTIAP